VVRVRLLVVVLAAVVATALLPACTLSASASNVANPFLNARFAAYLHDRTNLVTAAVYDVQSGKTYVYDPGVREKTASMAKIDILADLLYEHQQSDTSLTPKQTKLATSMIEQSNNNSANKLFTAIGGYDAISAFNKLLGFNQTIESYDWGQIETTPFDQLKLLKVIALPNNILTTASRTYEMGLMESVISSERFGLGWGSPTGALVGQKDGWYPESDTGWQVNTTGFVEFHDRFYLATVMCTKNPDENYGISTVTQASTYLWQFLKP
jgi:Beta-lactamase enzyme family